MALCALFVICWISNRLSTPVNKGLFLLLPAGVVSFVPAFLFLADISQHFTT